MPSYLVTGAGRGLGLALVKVLAADPANIVLGLARDRNAAEGRLAKENIFGVHILAADITDGHALTSTADEAKAILGDAGLDVLINNAAYVSQLTALTSLHDYEADPGTVIEDTRKSMEVNVMGSLQATFAFLDLVKQGQMKKVVFISSGMGDTEMINEIELPNAVPYAISKGALSVLVSKLNASYADLGLLFMGICPGLVDTAEGPAPELSDELLARLSDITSKFERYAGGKFNAQPPENAAKKVLAAISRQSLQGGFGGTLRSHNGTTRWM